MSRVPVVPLVLAAALLSACASREKVGDRAAAVGDWKAAERAYAEALRKDPKKPELQQKYQQARAAALSDATRKAEACWAARDVECAFAESDYVVNLDGGNAAMAVMRANASREAGLLRARRAEEAAASGDLRGALALLVSAREASQDPSVTGRVAASSPSIVAGAVSQAEQLRAQAQYPQAIDLLGLAARVDPAVQPRLRATQAEYEQWKDAEAERLARDGDRLLDGGRWAEAEARYRAAVALRPQSRAQPLVQYAGHMARGDAALQRRDFPAAERAFSDAARLNADRGQAQAMLDRVQVRPYAVSFRSVLVRPVRPDGRPWAGPQSRLLDRLTAAFDEATRSGGASGAAVDAARRVPLLNQPVLIVTVALPDGRDAQTAPRRGAYALLEGSFTVMANGYDDRKVSLRVVHDDGGRTVDAGLVFVRLGDLVANGKAALANGAVIALELDAVPSDQPDGALYRLLPLPPAGRPAPAPGT
jgi:tetratricopeptide (TPR) repeat protein